MRIAVLIIGLGLVMIIGFQSCTVMVGSEMAQDDATSGAGAVGILMALLFLLGAAFAMGVPKASMVLFAIAALLGFGMGSSSEFSDLTIWGSVSLVLAILSYFGSREKRKKESSAA